VRVPPPVVEPPIAGATLLSAQGWRASIDPGIEVVPTSDAVRRFVLEWAPRALGPSAPAWCVPQPDGESLVVVAPWVEPFAVALGSKSPDLDGLDVERVPPAELAAGDGRVLRRITDRWVEPPAVASTNARLLLLAPAQTHRLALALVEAWRAGVLRGPHWVVDLHDSLAIAGETGTLRHRLLGTTTRGLVRGKTGTTNIASALSGYVGGRYAFVLVQNGDPVDWTAAHTVQDRFVIALAGLPQTP